MPTGLYVSVPFCRTKCTYCNFASGVFSQAIFERYVDRVCSDIEHGAETVARIGAQFDPAIDSVYLGGGTPTLLDATQLRRLFVTISQNFQLHSEAEISVECAPGTLSPVVIETLVHCGANRVSLGVQSFVDREAASVARLHNRQTVEEDITQLRAAGIANINLDLIAGLPHQTAESWEISLAATIASGAPHVSVYMLEVDDDSRLGRELIAGGTKYHAHFVPDDDRTADLYVAACERLEAAGIAQYEISNFARPGWESRHNLKYWTRQPYLGFGVDAHSMLLSASGDGSAVRFASRDSLEAYLAGNALDPASVSTQAALEETFFLGLRLVKGVDLNEIALRFGNEAVAAYSITIQEFVDQGLLEYTRQSLRLTPRGRLLSNEVFERFVSAAAGVA